MNFDPKPYLEFHRSEKARQELAVQTRLVQARQEALRLAQTLSRHLAGLRSIWLFGSVARGDPSRPDFDIDLALEGGDLYQAWDCVEDSPFAVDLVSLEHLPLHFRQKVEATGIKLT